MPAGQPVIISGSCGVGATVILTTGGVSLTYSGGTVFCSPDTIIDSAVDANGVPIQPGGTTSNTIKISYHGTTGTTAFACGLGNILTVSSDCNSPITLPGSPIARTLAPGTYTFTVDAHNGGITDPSPAKFTFTISSDTTPPTVTASPAGGIFNKAQLVTLTSNEGSTTIYYTTDGSDPTTTSTKYTGPIPIGTEGTTTLKFFGVDAANNKEAVQSATFTIDTTPPTVTASPAGSTFNTDQSVRLTASEQGATIYYTTDGSNPTTSSTVYDGTTPIAISSDTTLKFFAVDRATNVGTVQTETYAFDRTGPTVAASPSGTLSNTAQSVSLSSTDSDLDSIYYTINGADPDKTTGTLYTPGSTIPIDSTGGGDGTVTLKAIGYDKLGNAGPILTETYTFDRTGPSLTLDPSTGLSNKAQTVSASSTAVDLDSSAIFYTTDGSDPSRTNGQQVPSNGQLAVDSTVDGKVILKVIAYDKLGNAGPISTGTYTFDRTPPTVTASPKGALTNTPQSVSLSSTDADLDKIFYTTDGNKPTSSSTQYSGPIQISSEGTTVVKFFGVDKLGNQETVQSETYTIDTTPPQVTGTADRAPDSNTFYTHAVTVAWSGSDSGGSGIKSCDSPTTYSSPDGKDVKLTGSCTDNAGNSGTGTVTINYDANAPTSTTISSSTVQNGGKSKLNTIAFTLGGTDTVGVATYLCSLDGATFVQCPGTVQYTGLADGTHTFAAKAVDAAGNIATTPEQFRWTIDTVPPVISVPADSTVEATSSSGASVQYTATAQDNLDGSLTPTCTSPSGSTFPYTPPSPTTTIVSCSAQDSAGNHASASFKVTVRDTTPPDTRIMSIQTSGGGSSNTVTITLQGTDNVGVTQFKCALDSPTFNPCSSTVVLSNVRSGSHIFAASAVDTSGNVDPSPAVQPFTISGSPTK